MTNTTIESIHFKAPRRALLPLLICCFTVVPSCWVVESFGVTVDSSSWTFVSRRTRTRSRAAAFVLHLSPADPQNSHSEAAIDRLSGDENSDTSSKNNPLVVPDTGNVHIPSTGVSVSDAMDEARRDRFATNVVPLEGVPGVAQLVTAATATATLEPVRYLVALSPPPLVQNENNDTAATTTTTTTTTTTVDYCLVDMPPYSTELVERMEAFMAAQGSNDTHTNARLVAMLVTSRDAIHYDEAAAVLSTRRTDWEAWRRHFPDAAVVAYRLDVPRDCRSSVTQVLDGYGPFAWNCDDNQANATAAFVETGRPLTHNAWNHNLAQDILSGKMTPEDAENGTDTAVDTAVDTVDNTDDDYTPEAIRQREEGKRILAVYTPGHTFGSVSYVFPERNLCCSGYTLPVEDNRAADNLGIGGSPGPALDCRGYITTSKAGIARQTASAQHLVRTYGDRFSTVLPSRGDPLDLEGNSVQGRQQMLLEIIDQYQRIGQIYEQLGITSDDDDDDDE